MKRFGSAMLVLGVLSLGGMTACKKEPDAAQAHRSKGNEHLNKEEWAQAAAEYGLSLQADPNQEKVWEKKAFAHMKAGQMDEADAALLKTLDFKPDAAKKAEVYRNLGGMYLQQGNHEKAERYFLEAIKTDPKDELALGWLAEMFSQLGGARSPTAVAVPEHLEKALAYYDRAIEVKPDSPNAYLNKRIVMAKYMEHERFTKEAAEKEAAANAKDPAKVAEIKARIEQADARLAELKVKYDALTQQFVEVQKRLQQAQQK